MASSSSTGDTHTQLASNATEEGITLDDIFTVLGETPNHYFIYVFKSMEGIIHEDTGLIGSSEFIKAFCTFCSFGKDEILKTLFIFADSKHLSKFIC